MKKRVLYIHQHFVLPTESGGTRSWEFARRLVADGVDVTVLCGGPEADESQSDGIRIVRLPVRYDNTMSFTARLKSFMLFMARSTAFAVRNHYDSVIATSTPLTVAIPGVASKLRWRNRFVFEVRDLWPSVPKELGLLNNAHLIRLAEVLERVTYATADHVIALSPGMTDGVRRVNNRVPVTTIPNACDFDMFPQRPDVRARIREQLHIDDQTSLILYAGSMGQIYNIQWIVRTAAQLCGEKVRFVAFGAGKTLEENRRLAASLGLSPMDLLPGPRSKKQVAEYVQAADVILSSVQNLAPLHPASINKVFDAMAASRPIVLNHDGWMTDLIEEHEAGWRVSEDPAVAAHEILEILMDTETLSRAGAASGRIGRTRFHRDDLYRDFYSVVMNEDTTPKGSNYAPPLNRLSAKP